MTYKRKYDHEQPPSRRKRWVWLGWLIAAGALLYIFATPIAELLLIVKGHPNARAAVEMARGINFESEPLPTYTPPPTYTPYPTYTPVPTSTPTPTPTPIPPGAVLAHIHSEQKAELVVSEMQLSDRDFHVGIKDGLCSFGGDFNAVGKIEAGLDLTKLDEANVVYNSAKQEYTLKLPSPELTGCSIEYIRLIENSFTICNTDFDLLRRLGEVQAMRSFVDRAVERGIIGKAKEQSALILEDLVRSFTGKQVITEFAASARTPRMDASCKPRASSAYSYNRSRNIWSRH